MKALKETERIYYKYVETPWTNPIFSSSNKITVSEQTCTITYTLSANYATSNEQPYRAMDGDWNSNENCWWTNAYGGPTSEANAAWWQIQSSKKLKITQIQIKNEVASPVIFKTAIWQGSNDTNTWVNIKAIDGTNTAGYITTEQLEPQEGYYYHRLFITSCFYSTYSSSGVSIQEIGLSGYYITAIEGTSSDYDYYIDKPVYKSYAEVDKYWKNIDTAWTNPYLASNGTMGGANPACTGKNIKHYDYYYPFRSNAPLFNEGWCGQGLPNWLIYYNPTPVLVTTMSFVNREYPEYINAVTSGIIQGSNDNTSWENLYSFTNNVIGSNQSWNITVNATKAYKYIRIYITGVADAGTDNACWFSKVTINGYERTVVEGTADDYDFITYKKPRYGVR